MNFTRIRALFLRYFIYPFGKLDHICDLFYWPALDIILWGLTSIWVGAQTSNATHTTLLIVTAILFWQLVWRGNYEVSVNLLTEFWNRNLVNLFSTPLKLKEWMAALMLVGVGKILINIAFSSSLVYLFYSLNVFQMGWSFLPYCITLTIFGWFVGFVSGGMIIYYGQRIQMLAWMTTYAFAPFSAITYPLSILPSWMQVVGKCLPTTYVFEGMRSVLNGEQFSWALWLKSFGLALVFLVASIVFFTWMFEKSRAKGLGRLE
jgi:ABC-2 type transport system permease protein